jgi:multiple sugar transport system permease protein
MNQPSPLFRTVRHLLLMAGALVFLAPFIWMFLTSLKPADEIFGRELTLLPTRLAMVENYSAALTRVPLVRYLWNGIFVCAAILILQVLVLLPAAYAFAKIDFKGKAWAWRLVLLALMIPHQATAIPIYVMLHYAGMLNTLSALIVPFSISAFGIFLMRQFFLTVPDDLVHAARLDGMSEFELVWRVMLPTAVPALFAFAIFSVVWHWNDYFWPLLVISSPELATPPLGTMFFRNEEAGINYGPLMAGTVLITAPLLILFIAAQRRFIEGVTLTGVKG